MSDGKYTLAQLSELTELPQRKVRFYLHEHVVPPPEAKGKGHFGDEQLAALLAVKSLRDAGLSLDAIKDYLGDGGDAAGEQKAPGARVIAEIVAAVRASRDRLQPARLREVTDSILGVGPTLFSKVFSGRGRRAKPRVQRMGASTWDRIAVTSQLEAPRQAALVQEPGAGTGSVGGASLRSSSRRGRLGTLRGRVSIETSAWGRQRRQDSEYRRSSDVGTSTASAVSSGAAIPSVTCGRAPTPSQPSSTTSSSYALTVDGYAYALAVYRRELPGLVEELERRWLEEQGKALTFVELRPVALLVAARRPLAAVRCGRDRGSPDSHALPRRSRRLGAEVAPCSSFGGVGASGPPPKRRTQPGFRACPYCQRKSDDPHLRQASLLSLVSRILRPSWPHAA